MIKKSLVTIGWREWVGLPELGIDIIKAKIDTGARTSALHAYCIEAYRKQGRQFVRFGIHPMQRNDDYQIQCRAELLDQRNVTDSGGHREQRYVIKTLLKIHNDEWPIEVTLTNRDIMRFRMLLGRTALKGRFLINPKKSFLLPNINEM